ncbi:hypothetical protein Tco_0999255 [Tanacetum coccineum]
MAQQVIPAAQLVPRYHTIGRCNNYVVLQSILCSLKCKIVGQILLDHPLSYALTVTTDVPVLYLQQFWRTVSKVPGPKDTIKFMLDTQEFTYTVDMFCDILHFLVETLENPFFTPVNIETIEAFMNRVGYQGVVDKVSAFYMKNLAQPWQTMFKDDIPLVSVYTNGNILIRGMLIQDAFLTEEIRATDDFKDYETVFMNVDVPMNQPQPVVSTQGIHRKSLKITIKKKKQSTTPIPPLGDDRESDEVAEATIPSLTLHKTALAAEAQENIAKVQEKLDEEEIERWLLEPGSYKEHPKNVDGDDDEIEIEKKYDEIEKEKKYEEIEKEEKDDNVEKTDDVVKEKDIVDYVTGSMKIRKEQKRRGLIRSHIKNKFITHDFFMGKIREVLDHCNKVVHEITFAKTNEMIKQEMLHLVNLTVNKDREVDPINAQALIAKEFASHGPKMIEELF